MRSVASHGHARGIDGFHGSHGIAFDTGDLDQAAHRVARESQIVFHADLGSLLNLFHGATERFDEAGRRHGTGDSYLPLASRLRT